MRKFNFLYPSGVCGVLCLICGSFIGICYDSFVSSLLDETMIIRNGTGIYEPWTKPPVAPYLKVYFFNLTNAEEFLKGQKPIFEEIGPYSYKQRWRKVNIAFHDNGTVSFQTQKHYYFDRSKSIGSEDAIIQTLNVPLNAAVDKVKNMGKLAHIALSSMLSMMDQTAFVQKTVRELIWGYPDTLLSMGSRLLPNIPVTQMGFFYGRNGSLDGVMNVNTGENGFKDYMLINTFNHVRNLPYWKAPECNMINGSDGTSFPPHLKKQDNLYVFNEYVCRSLPLVYNNTLEVYGLDAYRFVPHIEMFASAKVRPENECFCVGGPPCIGGGVFNINACKYGTPTVVSLPHFLHADEAYLNSVVGLRPDPSIHGSFIDVQPKMGTTLGGQFRFQINFKTAKLENIDIVENMTEMVFPVIWFDEGTTILPDSVVSGLRTTLVLPNDIKLFLLVILFAFGGVLTFGSILAYSFLEHKDKAKATMICKIPACVPLSSSFSDSEDTESLTNAKTSACSQLLLTK